MAAKTNPPILFKLDISIRKSSIYDTSKVECFIRILLTSKSKVLKHFLWLFGMLAAENIFPHFTVFRPLVTS